MLIAQIVDISQIDELFDTSSVSPWDPVFAAIALVVGVIVGRVARAAIRRYGRRSGLAPNLIDLFGTVAVWATFSLAVLIALSLIGFNAAPIWFLVLVVGALFVVSGRQFLENFGAGVMLQARTPFVPGDSIRTGTTIGRVREVNSRVVVIDTVTGVQVYVPNHSVLSNPIENLTFNDRRMSTIDVSVIYGTPLAAVKRDLTQAMQAADLVLDDPQPFAEVTEFAASGITIAARFWHRSGILEARAATDSAALAIDRAIREGGYEFAFPQLTLWQGAQPEGASE